MPSKRITITCDHCGQLFQRSPSPSRVRAKNYCSRDCWKAGIRAPRILFTCLHCGIAFELPLYQTTKRDERAGVYCSRSCKALHQRGGLSLRWTGGRSVDSKGYIRINVEGRGQILEHRFVMEQAIGRPLASDEHIHHKNGIPQDNRLENLQIVNAKEHAALHNVAQRLAQHRTKLNQWSRRHTCCVECSTTARKHIAKGMCESCYKHAAKIRRHQSLSST